MFPSARQMVFVRLPSDVDLGESPSQYTHTHMCTHTHTHTHTQTLKGTPYVESLRSEAILEPRLSAAVSLIGGNHVTHTHTHTHT